MADIEIPVGGGMVFAKAPDPSLITTTHIIYGLHALSILIGLTSAITIVGAFVFGIPSIIAVIINYVNQANARGTFLESHFRWQIRTFWFAHCSDALSEKRCSRRTSMRQLSRRWKEFCANPLPKAQFWIRSTAFLIWNRTGT